MSVPTSSETGSVSAGWMPRRRRVQRELADRDRHPARALVAEAEDPLVVGDDDQPDVVVRAVAEQLRDPVDVGRGDPQAAGPPDDVAELLARPADRRRVDDRQELLEVLGEQPVEERRVAVLERGQADVLLERRRSCARRCSSSSSTCSSIVRTRSGRSPRSPNAARSSAGKARSLVSSRAPSRAGRAQRDRGRAGRPRCRRTGRGGVASGSSLGAGQPEAATGIEPRRAVGRSGCPGADQMC